MTEYFGIFVCLVCAALILVYWHGIIKQKQKYKRLLGHNLVEPVPNSEINQQQLVFRSDTRFSPMLIHFVEKGFWKYFLFLPGILILLASDGSIFQIGIGGGLNMLVAIALYSSALIKTRRLSKLSSQLPAALDLIIRSARVGVSLENALRDVTKEVKEPLAGIFQEIEELSDVGISLEEVFDKICDKYPIPEFQHLASILVIQRKSGGQYADLLANLNLNLRKHKERKERIATLTSEARSAAKIITVFTLLLVGFLINTNGAQTTFLINDPAGQKMLFYCIGSSLVGYFTIFQLLEKYK
jgi:Flp pilus assembly protein TadB